MRLGERRHGCLHSTGSAAVEELHLPTEADCKWGFFILHTENSFAAIFINNIEKHYFFSESILYYLDFYSSVCIKREPV